MPGRAERGATVIPVCQRMEDVGQMNVDEELDYAS